MAQPAETLRKTPRRKVTFQKRGNLHQGPNDYYHDLGYRNIFSGTRQPPCRPCLAQASFLQNFDNNNPLLDDCTCRAIPLTRRTWIQIIHPITTRGITHSDIGQPGGKPLTENDWHILVFKPFLQQTHMGLHIRFIPFLPHAIENRGHLPQAVIQKLSDIQIGSDYKDLLTFTFRDLPNAFLNTNYVLSNHIQRIIDDNTRQRTHEALTRSCQNN
jgi:hypothetical protein